MSLPGLTGQFSKPQKSREFSRTLDCGIRASWITGSSPVMTVFAVPG
jgi:hypothetical protein